MIHKIWEGCREWRPKNWGLHVTTQELWVMAMKNQLILQIFSSSLGNYGDNPWVLQNLQVAKLESDDPGSWGSHRAWSRLGRCSNLALAHLSSSAGVSLGTSGRSDVPGFVKRQKSTELHGCSETKSMTEIYREILLIVWGFIGFDQCKGK